MDGNAARGATVVNGLRSPRFASRRRRATGRAIVVAATILCTPLLAASEDELSQMKGGAAKPAEVERVPTPAVTPERGGVEAPAVESSETALGRESSAAAGGGGAASTPREKSATPAPHPRVVEEIIVTAQKKTESVRDVPISMTVLGGDFLREAGIDDMHELVKYAPNVRFSSHITVFVRGFGTPFSTGAFDPSVGLALDELSIPRENYMGDPLYDIEQFEVLRGPQGTLFGKNTPAGLFNVKTARPTRDLTGFVLGRVGDLGVHRVEAAIGGPVGTLGDLAQFRLAVVDAEQEKDIYNTLLGNSYPDTKQRAGRLQLALQPLAGLDVLLIGERAITDTGYTHTLQTADVRDTSIEFLRRFDPRFVADGLDHKTSINLPNNPHRETDRLQTNLRYRLGDLGPAKDLQLAAVLGQTGFDMRFPFDVDVSPADILNLDPKTQFNYDQRSVELRASGVIPAPFGFGEIEILAGTLLFESKLFSDHFVVGGKDFDDYLQSPAAFELVTGSPPPGGVGFSDVAAAFIALGLPPPGTDTFDGDGAHITLDQKTTSQAIFGNLAWHAFEDWTLSFGARMTFERKHAHIVNKCLDPGLICPVLMAQEYDVIRNRKESDFSPKATLQYAPTDELTLFVTRGEGFKSGGYNNLAFTLDSIEVDSEKVTSWEVGARGTLFDSALSYGATLFRMDATDLQLQNVVGALVQTRNAASARSQGLELDFEWLTPWEPLRIHGAGALTDARFKKFPNATAPANSSQATQDLSGRPMPFVPKRQFNLTPNLRFPLRGDGIQLLSGLLPRDLAATAALDLLYRSSFFLDSDLDERLVQGDSWMLDGRIGFGSADDSLTLGLTVKNITDAKVLEFATDSILFPPGFLKIQEFQRAYAVDLRYRW